MERSKTQFSRLLELDRRIRNGDYPNCLTFSAEWEVTQKTAQRDIDYLRDQLGAPIEYDRIKKGYYYTDLHWFLPSVSMSEGELIALLLASRSIEQYKGTPVARELEKVFRKLAELLPDKLSIRPELIFTRFSFRTPPAKPISESVWAVLVRGLLNQRSVKIEYQAFEAKNPRNWTIHPYHIANLQGEWYLFGATPDDKEVLQFSMARIHKATLTEQRFDMPQDFDSDKLLANVFGRYAVGSEEMNVRLLFDREVADWITERQWHPQQKVIKRKNGGIELSFEARGLLEVQRWVLAWGGDVRVLAPRELKKAVKLEVEKLSRVYCL